MEELQDRVAETNVIEKCLESGANVNWTSPEFEYNTALHFCCDKGHESCLEILLKAGADVNASNLVGQTPLMLAASKKHTRMARLLLNAGAKPNVKDKVGSTAIVYAVRSFTTIDTLHLVRTLLRAGAEVYIPPKILKIEVRSSVQGQPWACLLS
jgi:ankyrin repeat protein